MDATPAPLSKRINAFSIDIFLMMFVFWFSPPLMRLAGLPDSVIGTLYLTFIAFFTLSYDPLCVYLWGRTLGHALVGVQVVSATGGRVALKTALMRYPLKVLLGAWSFVTVAFGKPLAVHDLCVNTKVIVRPKKSA